MQDSPDTSMSGSNNPSAQLPEPGSDVNTGMHPEKPAPEAAPAAPAQPNGSSTSTIAQLIIYGLGMVFSLLAAAGLFLIGLVGIFSKSSNSLGGSAVPIFNIAWIALLVAVLLTPSIVIDILRLMGRRLSWRPRFPSVLVASILLILWPLILFLGTRLSGQTSVNWLIVPPLQILAVGLPIWWLIEVARRKISLGNPQRDWGILGFSMLVTTPLTVIVETVLLIVLAIAAVVYLTSQPEMLRELQNLSQQLRSIGQDQEALLKLLQPYLQNPLAVFSVFALIAGVIPMLEELFKPLALWMLVDRQLTPAQGFVAGAICGGAFALLESLLTIGGQASSDSWAALAIGRAGTALLHITTTSLSGWALASAWKNGAYFRLAATYLLSCSLHGLWNGLSILNGINLLLPIPPANLVFLSSLSKAAPFALALLVVSLFVLLVGMNLRLNRGERSNSLPVQPLDPPYPPA